MTSRDRIAARREAVSAVPASHAFGSATAVSVIDQALHLAKRGLEPEVVFTDEEYAKFSDLLDKVGISRKMANESYFGREPDPDREKVEKIGLDVFKAWLRAMRAGVLRKKEFVLAEARMASREQRSLARVRRALGNLLRSRAEGAARAIEEMARGGRIPSWVQHRA